MTSPVRRCAQLLHILAEMAVGIAFLVAVGLGALAWRLSQGPLDMAWLARRLEVAASRDITGTRLHIGHAALVWEGWQRGVDQPFDIRVLDTTAVAPNGAVIAAIPSARIDLSPGWLLLGRTVPRVIEMDGARLRVLRAADGAVSLDLGTLSDNFDDSGAAGAPRSPFDTLLTDLARPPETDRTPFGPGFVPVSQLREVRIHDARVVVVDRQLGAVWSAPRAEIDLRRDDAGAVSGFADVALALGPEHAQLSVRGTAAAGGGETKFEVHLTPISPAALARGAIGLAPLANLDAPLTLSATATFGPRLVPRQWSVQASLGAGHAQVGTSRIPLKQATLAWSGDGMASSSADLALVLPTSAHDANVHVRARLLADTPADPTGARVVQAAADIDQLSFADLPTFWPAGAADDARNWVLENIPTGLAHDGHLDLTLAVPTDRGSPRLTGLTGQVQGDNVTAYWLRPVPPIEHGQASLHVDSPDVLSIAVHAGQTGALSVRNGLVRISGLAQPDQDLTIAAVIDGPVKDAIALLRQKRLHLLDRHPVDLRDPSGTASTQLNIALPLTSRLTIDMVKIHTSSAVKNLHLSGLIAGKDLDQGQLDLAVTPEALTIKGQAEIAHIPADLTAGMDFRDGPPSQIVQHASVAARASGPQLAAAGLDPLGLVSGAVDLTAQWQQQRNGQADVRAHADLQPARMDAVSVGWSKPAGAAASLDAHLHLDHGKLTAIDGLRAEGPDLSVEGHAETAAGVANTLVIDQAVLGRTRLKGRVSFPDQPDQPIRASAQGPLLDLSARLSRRGRPQVKPQPAPTKPPVKGTPWVVDARFDRVLMANDDPVADMVLHAEDDGLLLTRGTLRTADAGELTLVPDQGGRHLTGRSDDAGALLRALDIVGDMQGGQMTLDARYDDALPAHPLTGTAEISDFRLRNAPAMARLLQAMTLYGLVDLVQGPGLGFDRLIAPFRLEGDLLDLMNARVHNASLGLTAKGQFDLARDTLEVQGTIIPAYFFNSLLGGLPLVGSVFSPEKDGGLFAATYGLHGAFADPTVRVNPLAALTPGFLRGIFD